MASGYDVSISCETTDCSKFLSSLRHALGSREIGYSIVNSVEHPVDVTSESRGDTSKFSVIIISKHYSSSEKTLRHLVRARNRRHSLFPIFYRLQSSELSEDGGEFWTAFYQNTERFRIPRDDVDTCKAVLKDARYEFGWDVPSDADDESQVAEKIADEISRRIRSLSSGWSESLSNSSPPTNRRPESMAAKALELIQAAKARACNKAAKTLELIEAEKIMFATIAINILVEVVVLAVGISPLSKKSPAVKLSLLGLSSLSFLFGVLELIYQIKRDGLLSQLRDCSTVVGFSANAAQLGAAVYEICKKPQKCEDDLDPSSLLPIFFAVLVADVKIRCLRAKLKHQRGADSETNAMMSGEEKGK